MTTQDTPQLRDEYRKLRKTALLFRAWTNADFDQDVRATMVAEGLPETPQGFVNGAQLVLDGVLAAEDRLQDEREYHGDGDYEPEYFEDFYNDHMGYDTLEERDMDREE